ncbi:MAG: hypothetical protein VXZ18_19085, partial [Pseudomonadota bacterium]|nr:hypothetical protein [Pseudomonadota bacterium]
WPTRLVGEVKDRREEKRCTATTPFSLMTSNAIYQMPFALQYLSLMLAREQARRHKAMTSCVDVSLRKRPSDSRWWHFICRMARSTVERVGFNPLTMSRFGFCRSQFAFSFLADFVHNMRTPSGAATL